MAAAHLLAQGYTLITRRYHARGGELDIVALDGEQLVVIEVKARSGEASRPADAIDHRKLKRLTAAAEQYLAATGKQAASLRFDLITFEGTKLVHQLDAFKAE